MNKHLCEIFGHKTLKFHEKVYKYMIIEKINNGKIDQKWHGNPSKTRHSTHPLSLLKMKLLKYEAKNKTCAGQKIKNEFFQ